MRQEDFQKYIDEKYAKCSNGMSGKSEAKGWDYIFKELFYWSAWHAEDINKALNDIIENGSDCECVERLIMDKIQESMPYYYYEIKYRTGTPLFYAAREFMEKYGKFFKTDSDMACVMIYSKDEKVKIYVNGKGSDGAQRVSIIREDIEIPFRPCAAAMFELTEGGYVSEYDCEMIPSVELEAGRYYAYNVSGLVMIQKI